MTVAVTGFPNTRPTAPCTALQPVCFLRHEHGPTLLVVSACLQRHLHPFKNAVRPEHHAGERVCDLDLAQPRRFGGNHYHQVTSIPSHGATSTFIHIHLRSRCRCRILPWWRRTLRPVAPHELFDTASKQRVPQDMVDNLRCSCEACLMHCDPQRYASQCKIRPLSSGRSRRNDNLRDLCNMPVSINVEGTKANLINDNTNLA